MRKRLSLVLVLALSVIMAYGVIGTGAAFLRTVTAEENINVGTFDCLITDATPAAASDGIATDGRSLTFTAPTIQSSAPGSAPFSFTVKNTGSIAQTLTVATEGYASPFSIIGAPFTARALAAGASTQYATGVEWDELTNANLGAQGTVTWTVTCAEQPAVRLWSAGIAGPVDSVFPSTMAANEAAGWAYATVDDSTITFQSVRQVALGGSCMEYRFNDNVPNQIVATNGGVNWNPLVTDGLWPRVCIGSAYPSATATVAIPAGVTTFEVRSAFGAESEERFAWTRFNLIP